MNLFLVHLLWVLTLLAVCRNLVFQILDFEFQLILDSILLSISQNLLLDVDSTLFPFLI